MPTPSALLNVMIDAARKAARGLARDFGEVTELQVSKKGAADFVSNADLKAEQTLFEILTKARPGYGFLGEERGMVEGTDKTHTWIVDPLDGTTNFLHAIPHFAVNIALQREGEGIVAGVTYNPITNDLFWVEKGKGAFLGAEKRLRVAARRHLDESVLATGVPFAGKPGHAQFLKELHQVSQKVAGVRRFGSANVRTKVIYPIVGTQFFAGSDCDAVHGFDANARFFKEVHQEVGFPELRHQFFAQMRHRDSGSGKDRQHESSNRQRVSYQRRQHSSIDAF